jgi:hypothetical protein
VRLTFQSWRMRVEKKRDDEDQAAACRSLVPFPSRTARSELIAECNSVERPYPVDSLGCTTRPPNGEVFPLQVVDKS